MEDRDRQGWVSPHKLFAWHREGLRDYAPIGAHLPVVENALTPTAPGPSTFSAAIVSNTEVTLARALMQTNGVGRTVLRPGFLGFYIPLRWEGVLKINGLAATRTAIHLPVEGACFHIQGRERELLGCNLPRAAFVETVAALRGVDPGEAVLCTRAVELTPDVSGLVRNRLTAILNEGLCAGRVAPSSAKPFDLTNEVFDLMVSMYLQACPEPMRKAGSASSAARIVRAAEERFAQAAGEPVSLADLCLAAGVSQTALHAAFQSWCGEPPMAYFRKRKLALVRARLLHAENRRGAVKEAALDLGLMGAGMCDFGRFSRNYRRLFGEAPSVTLSQACA